MDVLLLCLVILGLAAFVAAPLYRREPAGRPAAVTSDEAAEHMRERALDDLEIDRRSGLIDEAAYDTEHRRLATGPDHHD